MMKYRRNLKKKHDGRTVTTFWREGICFVEPPVDRDETTCNLLVSKSESEPMTSRDSCSDRRDYSDHLTTPKLRE